MEGHESCLAPRDTATMLTAALAAALLSTPLQAQATDLLSGAEEVTLTGRVQLQARTSTCSDVPFAPSSPCVVEVPAIDAFMRRVRFAAKVKINDFIEGKVEPDFGEVDGVVLRDAYGRLNFSDHVRLQLGQFKRPFDGFNLTSSSRLLTVERDVDIPGVPSLRAASLSEFTSRFNLGSYDIGIMLYGSAGERLDYWVGGFNGEPSSNNADRDDEKQFVGRLQYSLDTGVAPLALAAAAAFTDRPFTGPGGEIRGEYYRNVELWAELGDFRSGPHVQAGLVLGDNPLQDATGSDPVTNLRPDGSLPDLASLRAWQVIGTYKHPLEEAEYLEAVEPVLRFTRAEPNTDVSDDENWAVTPGFNVYFAGRNKLQFSWDFVSFADDGLDSANSFKSLFQVYF